MARKKTDTPREKLAREEMEAQNGEELPEREVMSVISVDPDVPVSFSGEPVADDPETYPGDPQR